MGMFSPKRIVGSARDLGANSWKAGMNTFGDFRKFLLRGNVVDLAVGVVIGAAFNGLVQGVVTDLIQPLVGLFLNVDNFSAYQAEFQGQVFAYGHFLGLLLSFLITAAVVYFFVVKPIAHLQDRFENLRGKAEEVTTRDCPFCLSTIPLKATRCAHCTSELPPVQEEAAPGV